MLQAAVVLVALLATGLARPEVRPRIVGGVDADIGEFPYMASLQLKGALNEGHFCAGVILSENVVMTVGQCVKQALTIPFDHVEVFAGLNALRDPGPNLQTAVVRSHIIHPDFEGGQNPNDIAIYILDTPLVLNEFVSTIALPEADEEPRGEAVLAGWGSFSNGSFPAYPPTMQKATVPIISFAECEEAWGAGETSLAPTNICTGPLSGGVGACIGDGGDALTQDGKVVGIVSWSAIQCGSAPTVHTRVSAFIDFISEQLALAKSYL